MMNVSASVNINMFSHSGGNGADSNRWLTLSWVICWSWTLFQAGVQVTGDWHHDDDNDDDDCNDNDDVHEYVLTYTELVLMSQTDNWHWVWHILITSVTTNDVADDFVDDDDVDADDFVDDDDGDVDDVVNSNWRLTPFLKYAS